jgi:hypothetical protein
MRTELTCERIKWRCWDGVMSVHDKIDGMDDDHGAYYNWHSEGVSDFWS